MSKPAKLLNFFYKASGNLIFWDFFTLFYCRLLNNCSKSPVQLHTEHTLGDIKQWNIVKHSMFSMDFESRVFIISPEYVDELSAKIPGEFLLRTIVYSRDIRHVEPDNLDLPERSNCSAHNIFNKFVLMLNDPKVPFMSVNDYAGELNISAKYFSAICKQMSGKSASDIINEEKIRVAKQLLSNKSKNIKQIADELNFANQSHFGTFFKRYVGISPQKSGTRSKGRCPTMPQSLRQ